MRYKLLIMVCFFCFILVGDCQALTVEEAANGGYRFTSFEIDFPTGHQFESYEGHYYITTFTELSTNRHFVGVRKSGEEGFVSNYTNWIKDNESAWLEFRYNPLNDKYGWRMIYLHADHTKSPVTYSWTHNAYFQVPADAVINGIYHDPENTDNYINDYLKIYLPVAQEVVTNKDYHSIWFRYAIPTPDEGSSAISFNVSGGTHTTWESHKKFEKDGYTYGDVNIHQGLEMGTNEITVTASANGKTYSDSRMITRKGFVDEDGDGYDDNTGEGWWPNPDESDWGDGVPQPPGEDGTIFDYIKYLSDSLIYSMNQMLVMLRSFMGGLAQLGEVFRSFFSFMPPQFSAIILLGLIMAVILRVVSR